MCPAAICARPVGSFVGRRPRAFLLVRRRTASVPSFTRLTLAAPKAMTELRYHLRHLIAVAVALTVAASSGYSATDNETGTNGTAGTAGGTDGSGNGTAGGVGGTGGSGIANATSSDPSNTSTATGGQGGTGGNGGNATTGTIGGNAGPGGTGAPHRRRRLAPLWLPAVRLRAQLRPAARAALVESKDQELLRARAEAEATAVPPPLRRAPPTAPRTASV